LAANVRRSPALRTAASSDVLRLSPLFEVRYLGATDVVERLRPEDAEPSGWWAFVLRDDDVLGVAELALAAEGILYAGIHTGELGRRATAALVEAERATPHRDTVVWFLRIAPLFYTAVVLETEGGPTVLPVEGSAPTPEALRELARSRIEAARELAARASQEP
jgi:hypothetical protein